MFEKFIAASDDVAEVVASIYEATENNHKERRRLYVFGRHSIAKKFAMEDVMSEIGVYSLFDVDHENSSVSGGAKIFERIRNRFSGREQFELDLQNDNIAGFLSGDLMYCVTICVNSSAKWQVTCWAKGIGALSDSKHYTVDDMFNSGVIPASCTFINKKQILEIESNYYPSVA